MTPVLDAVRREELRKLAEAATPGEWLVDPDDRPDMEWNNHIVSADNPELRICFMTSDGRTIANAAHIAANSPSTTLALLAYIAELEGGGWQPIETAPKTSHAIMVWCPERRNTYEVTWDSIFHLSDEWPERRKPGWQHFGGDRRLLEVPTHWRHLPMPPEDAALLPKASVREERG